MLPPDPAPPVTPDDLVGSVLERDAALVDVFARHSPHFEKLRNPVLRRTMARLVTVEQAAAIAGVAPATLVHDLNAALGVGPAGAATAGESMQAGAPSPAASEKSRPTRLREVELDLRDDLRRGIEPFARIMAAVGALRDDEVLHLRAIFQPVPLFAVLARRGLQHEVRAHAADDWSVWFWRGDASAPAVDGESTPVAVDPFEAAERPVPAGERWLDVRGLEPPEPMVRTLAALESLGAHETLVQVNVRIPQFLLPELTVRGFTAQVDESHGDRVLVRIRRRAVLDATSA